MKAWKILACLAAILLSSCSTFQFGLEPTASPTQPPVVNPTEVSPPTQVVLPPSPTSLPVVTATLPPQPTPTSPPPAPTTIPPTDTQVPTAVPATQAPAGTAPAKTTLQIYLVAIGDGGKSGQKIGCGDSLVPVKVEVPYTLGVLRTALNKLLSIKDQYYGQSGLYDALYQSDLQVNNVVIQNGKALVYLTGTMTLGGECDNPRVEAQLTQIALQFSTVQEVQVYIKDKTLEEALSLK